MQRLATIIAISLVGCSGTTAQQNEHTSEAHQVQESPHARGHGAHGRGRGHGHGHGHHRFEDAEAWAGHFEDPSRDEWQRPDVVIQALGLTSESHVADIGAATGYFPTRIARLLPSGRVWGIDIEPDMVRYLNARARSESLGNLYSILGTADDPLIPEPVDAILMVNTYHHIDGREEYFRNLLDSLRPGGRLVIVDYKMGELPEGPPESMRIPPDQVRGELEAVGYRLLAEDIDSLPRQYILVFLDSGTIARQ